MVDDTEVLGREDGGKIIRGLCSFQLLTFKMLI